MSRQNRPLNLSNRQLASSNSSANVPTLVPVEEVVASHHSDQEYNIDGIEVGGPASAPARLLNDEHEESDYELERSLVAALVAVNHDSSGTSGDQASVEAVSPARPRKVAKSKQAKTKATRKTPTRSSSAKKSPSPKSTASKSSAKTSKASTLAKSPRTARRGKEAKKAKSRVVIKSKCHCDCRRMLGIEQRLQYKIKNWKVTAVSAPFYGLLREIHYEPTTFTRDELNYAKNEDWFKHFAKGAPIKTSRGYKVKWVSSIEHDNDTLVTRFLRKQTGEEVLRLCRVQPSTGPLVAAYLLTKKQRQQLDELRQKQQQQLQQRQQQQQQQQQQQVPATSTPLSSNEVVSTSGGI